MDPSPPAPSAKEKPLLRARFRRLRKEHFAALPQNVRALVFNRPPAPVVARLPDSATIGLYHPVEPEAPTGGWARWLAENGRRIALPAFDGRDDVMHFRVWNDPWGGRDLVDSPWGGKQPASHCAHVTPDVLIVPLLGFTARGDRLGQGGGHYDRWLADHPDVPAIGLAWDCQLAEALPVEAHDRRLVAVVTPTRIFEGES